MERRLDQMSFLKTFSRKIITRRYEKQISQQNLAEMAEIHINTLSNIERELTNPTFTIAVKLSIALDISLDELMLSLASDAAV